MYVCVVCVFEHTCVCAGTCVRLYVRVCVQSSMCHPNKTSETLRVVGSVTRTEPSRYGETVNDLGEINR